MTTPKTQVKLGLLVLCTLAAAAVIAIVLGLHVRRPVDRYHSYFDESVSGLDVGSAVEFRGVRIGSVGAIKLAPDRVRIDVALDITKSAAAELDLPTIAPRLRARLETSGITGVKYVDLSPGEAETPPRLGFTPAHRYIPARRSFLSTLEADALRLGKSLPALVDRTSVLVDRIGHVVDTVEGEQVVPRLATAVEDADAAVRDVRQILRGIAHAGLSAKLIAMVDDVSFASRRMRTLFGKLEGDGELERSIRDLGRAARAFRELVEAVEREPDMLVKGRAPSRRK